MKKYQIIISLSLMLFATAAFGQNETQFEFTLQECLDYAIENNQKSMIEATVVGPGTLSFWWPRRGHAARGSIRRAGSPGELG